MTIQNSINTNVGALVALRNLNTVASDLQSVQNRVSTGLRVSSAQEDASVFSVAQGIRAELKGFEAVNGALAGSKGIVTVAISSATSVSNLLGDVRTKLSQLADESISSQQREIFTDDLRAQVDQLRSFLEGAEYNGRNILSGDQGTNGDDFTNFDVAEGVRTIKNIDGGGLEIRANDLVLGSGGTNGTTGFIALSRIVYSTDTTDGGANGQVGDDTAATNIVDTTDREFTARSIVNARVAQAALAGLTDAGGRQTDAFRSADSATAGSDSVFNSAFSLFEAEVNEALGQLGADNRSIEFQVTFNQSLSDATTEGLGNLVDADLAKESARLQALQTKQQLSIQALAIANQQPTNVLALFN
ncbi:MAG: flagellin [Pseudomonadota bacterium]